LGIPACRQTGLVVPIAIKASLEIYCVNLTIFIFIFDHLKQNMQFKSIIGQQEVKRKLVKSVHENRVAHTQLILGPEGSGSMALAIAFIQFINCKNKTETDSCGVCPSCIKYQKFSHPDLHLYFPSTTNNRVKKDPKSKLFLPEFREYLEHCSAYPTQQGWYGKLGVGNKQGTIYTRDAADIVQEMSLKSYEAEYKTFIIWMPERLHESASNKLLKTFEEPPDKTLILLVGERYELLLPTVRSRAQLVKVTKLKDDEVADALFNAARDWIKVKGLDTMRGPASFSVNDECGLLMDAFDQSPLVMMTYNPEYYIKLFQNYGLEKSMDLLAYSAEVKPPPERLKRLSDNIEKRGHFTVRSLKTKNKKKLRKDIEKIFTIYEEAWEKNWGYVPMSADEFDLLVDSLLPIILPELVFIAEIDGKPVGLAVTMPDYNFVLKKMRGRVLPFGWLKFLYYKNYIPSLRVVIMGVLDAYKGRGIDVVMYCKTHEVAQNHKIKFKEAEFSWILESNTMMNKIAKTLDAKVYKTYRMFDKKI